MDLTLFELKITTASAIARRVVTLLEQRRHYIAEIKQKRKVNRTKWNVFLDVALTLIFIIEMEEGFTGLPMHEALGLGFGVALILHLALHWDWIVNLTRNFYVDAGGDIQVYGYAAEGIPWRIGIRHPFDSAHIVKTLSLTEGGVATSGLYNRGKHIYNPLDEQDNLDEVVSLTVVGIDVFEADRLATAVFAMGPQGIQFIEQMPDVEGYSINRHGIATQTSHFAQYVDVPVPQ